MTHRVQLAVEYADHQTRYYPANRGWRVDAASRCIVIGRDLPRTYVPLDRITNWTVERVGPTDTEATPDDVQNLLDDAAVAFANAGSQSERVEVLRDLLAGWYAAWPDTAVTDPNEPIAWQLASIIAAAEARASAPVQSRRIHEPCGYAVGSPGCNRECVFGSDADYQHPANEMVWLGDLSGYTVEPDGDRVVVRHRCGFKSESVEAAHLASIIATPVTAHRLHGCRTEG